MDGVLTKKIIYVYRDGGPTNVYGRLIAAKSSRSPIKLVPTKPGLADRKSIRDIFGIFQLYRINTYTYISSCFAYGKCGGKKR